MACRRTLCAKVPLAITVGLAFSCLSAWSIEVLEIIPTPAPRFLRNGTAKSKDLTQALELQFEGDGESQRLKFHGQGGSTRDWKIPSWMVVRSVIFAEDAAWFMIWCQKGGASLPVCLARCSLRGPGEDGLVFFDDTVGGFRIRGLVSQKDGQIVAVGGQEKGQVKHDEKYSGKWLRLRAAENEFREISWEKMQEVWGRRMERLRGL